LLDEAEATLPRPDGKEHGFVHDYYEGAQNYVHMLRQTSDEDFSGIHVAIDGADGATSSLAPRLFGDLEAEVSTIGTTPNRLNINDRVVSTHPEHLAAFVKEKGADVGLTFDGDGDRLITVDENGEIVDGDKIMFICGKYLNELGRLKDNTIVATVMSKLGFHKTVEENGMTALQTAIGDRYVVEEMRKNDYTLGGEQSGHIIFMDYSTTGDGMLSGVQLLQIMKATCNKLSELAAEMPIFPQRLVNIRV
jgi:phosphoglucosamine mutase